jgi:hypothetical protein
MENEILSWAYWESDKSEIIRNFALALAALIGVPFLIWRTFGYSQICEGRSNKINGLVYMASGPFTFTDLKL